MQNLKAREKAINSFKAHFDIDIYITGSNAYLLSSELSTLLSGRFIEIKIYPLSFKEFLVFNNYDNNNLENKFNEYLKFGGLPAITSIKNNSDLVLSYLDDIYNTIVKKDIIDRNNIKDTALLENVVYLELLRRGYRVNIGKSKDYEVDFVAKNPNTIKYYQVTQTLSDEKVKAREICSLESINDNYEKIILTMDKSINKDFNGIKVVNIIDWLIKDKTN